MSLNASFANALKSAHEAAAAQHYPPSALYVVATPIGNLADITLRALHVLHLADSIACEDTRHTQPLLRAYGIEKGSTQLLAVHQHNEAQACDEVLRRLKAGQRVAYVSDAGTPGVSDPGARLVAAVVAAGLKVVPLPGASSITAALSVAGIVHEGGFVFVGFPPAKTMERDAVVAAWALEPRTVVLLEAPHRIDALAMSLSTLGARPVTVARELSKQFEEVVTLPAQTLGDWLRVRPQRQRGEFVLVLHPQNVEVDAGEDLRVLRLLLTELPVKTAVKLAAQLTGTSRNSLYELALELKDAVD